MTARMLAWKQLFIQRVRNSSLVERSRVDDDRASRLAPKLRTRTKSVCGRGAFPAARKAYREVFWSAGKRKCRHK